MQTLFEELTELGVEAVENEPLKRHTTMRVGGPADVLCRPSTGAQVVTALNLARSRGAQCVVIGNGSNIIFRDGGFRGLVVELGEAFSEISVSGTRVTAQAGAKLSRLSTIAMQSGLKGLEFAHGIPGSVGGGAAMNAGAYGGELKDVLTSVAVCDGKNIVALSRDEMEMGYRTTRALREGIIILEAAFELTGGDPREILAVMNELDEKRRAKQPVNLPSSGSTFKRPEGYFAGALIEGAGLKGMRVGGACVSEKHAGFVVNDSNATAKDVLELIDVVKKRVYENSGVSLECEVRVMGAD